MGVSSLSHVVDTSRFQDGLNEFKGQRESKILSEVLISFDNLDEYDEFKDYSDPVFSDENFNLTPFDSSVTKLVLTCRSRKTISSDLSFFVFNK